jgi:hypothetical protein
MGMLTAWIGSRETLEAGNSAGHGAIHHEWRRDAALSHAIFLACAGRPEIADTRAIRLLYKVGSLDRKEAHPGARYQQTAEGLHRRPILFRFGPDFLELFRSARRPLPGYGRWFGRVSVTVEDNGEDCGTAPPDAPLPGSLALR